MGENNIALICSHGEICKKRNSQNARSDLRAAVIEWSWADKDEMISSSGHISDAWQPILGIFDAFATFHQAVYGV